MKTLAIATVILGTASIASAQTAVLRGSDTLLGATQQAIVAAGLTDQLTYTGGGSGTGETGLRNGTQGIAPMSRELSLAAITDLMNQGVVPVRTVIGLDGVSLFVKFDSSVVELDIPTIRSIYMCTITQWEDVPGSGKTGPITVYRRDDLSGTTEVFRTLIGNGATPTPGLLVFGACVQPLASTAAITDVTSTEASAIGYAGLSGSNPPVDEEDVIANRGLAVAATASDVPVLATPDTIRDFSYPLSRRLFVNSVSEARVPTTAEQQLLDFMSSANMNTILVANDFVPCDESGCP